MGTIVSIDSYTNHVIGVSSGSVEIDKLWGQWAQELGKLKIGRYEEAALTAACLGY